MNLDGSGGSVRNFPAGITEKQKKTSFFMTGSLAEIRFKTSQRQVWRLLTPHMDILKKTGFDFQQEENPCLRRRLKAGTASLPRRHANPPKAKLQRVKPTVRPFQR